MYWYRNRLFEKIIFVNMVAAFYSVKMPSVVFQHFNDFFGIVPHN